MNIVFKPYIPEALIFVIVIIALLLNIGFYWHLSKSINQTKKIFLLVLRVGVILCLGIILLNPCRVFKHEEDIVGAKIVLAIDTSKSMLQNDVEKASRIDYIKRVFKQIKWLEKSKVDDITIQHYSFAESAQTINPDNIIKLSADGNSTDLYNMIKNISADANDGKVCKGLILFTDGRDHSGKSADIIAKMAEANKIPIYSLPVGSEGFLRDIEVNINSLNSFSFAKQPFIIESDIQTYGCEYETIKVSLFRNDKLVDSLTLNTKEQKSQHVTFKVLEEKAGLYNYRIYVNPVHDEQDIYNNESITFLNVIDKKIKLLLLEGSPHWDTTFLQRSLQRNPKLEIDSIIQYAPKRVHQIRQTAGAKILQLPTTVEEFSFYDIVLLGKNIDDLLSKDQIEKLTEYIQKAGGIVLSFRGNSFKNDLQPDFMPGSWSKGLNKLKVNTSEDEDNLDRFEPFLNLTTAFKNTGGPKIDGVFGAIQKKTLTSPMMAFSNNKKEIFPGAFYRRNGMGQVLSLGISGSWHWAFHPETDIEHKESDIFWEQTLLWLISKSNFRPGEKFIFSGNSNTMNAGKPYDFYLITKYAIANDEIPKVTVYHKGNAISEINLTTKNGQDFSGSFIPLEKGIYKAVLSFDKNKSELPFVIYGLNAEEKEVSADYDKLAQLAAMTSGEILKEEDLAGFIDKINTEKKLSQKNDDFYSIWDNSKMLVLILILFSMDWFFRRRWGLI